MNDLFAEAREQFPYSQSLRRDFHLHPELGFQEVRTAGIIARELNGLGLEVTTGIAQTGVVALIEGAHPGKTALLRFDMDALPIQEETGLEFSSLNSGVMHACGHDAHVAIGLTVARMLASHRDEIHGTVKLMFQPAEEGLGGAEGMLEAGILESPKVDFALGMHVWNELPVGRVAVPAGPLMAGAEIFKVVIEGKGGHGGLPQLSADPVVASAQIITALQTIVSRNLAPLDAAVVSVCQVKAGEAFNVIPQRAELSGTIRTFEPEVRQKVLARFEEIVQGVAAAMGCQAVIDMRRLTPAVINDPALADQVAEAASEVLPDPQLDRAYRSMVSEDMAYVLEQVPGCYFMIGSRNPDKGAEYGHHHPRFTIDEDVIPYGVAVMTAAALKLLS